jgi:hypothetical protein
MTVDMRIDRLRLNVSGFAAGPDGERLATLVAQGLAAAHVGGESRHIERIETRIAAGEHTVTEELSRMIVAEIRRQSSRTA